jgi:hypothetical protein
MKLNVLPPRTGISWVNLGLSTFFKQPLALGALFILYFTALYLIELIPIAGNVLILMLFPALTVGLMAAAREADNGKIPLPAILFIAFRQGPERIRVMMFLGFLYAAAFMTMIWISNLIDGGKFLSLVTGRIELGTPEQAQTQLADPMILVAMLVFMLLYLIISVIFWHAPALVHWGGVTPVKSLFFSSIAILRNSRPFLLYGFMWTLISMGVTMTVFFLVIVTQSPTVFRVCLFAGTLFLGTTFFTSVWFTFKDSFTQDVVVLNVEKSVS